MNKKPSLLPGDLARVNMPGFALAVPLSVWSTLDDSAVVVASAKTGEVVLVVGLDPRPKPLTGCYSFLYCISNTACGWMNSMYLDLVP